MLPFHFGFCTVWLSSLLMLLHKLTFLEVRISTRMSMSFFAVTFCFTRPMVATKIRQYGTQFIHNYIHCFFSNGKLCRPVLLCESIISSHPVPGAKQPGIPTPRKV